MKPITTFLVRAGLLGAPLALSLITYIAFDPFRVLRHYDFRDYYDEAAPVELNRDYVSLRLFDTYYEKEQFDSFIFGSSRSFPIHCDVWERHIPGGHPFHYPAASENIYGIAKKVEYLERLGVHIKNALVEVTTGLSGDEPRWDGLHRLPRELTGESWVDFQVSFLKAYFSEFYFVKYMVYAYTGTRSSFNRTVLGIDRGLVHIDPKTNDYTFAANERELAEDAAGYYAKRRADFPPHGSSPPCAAPVIGERQRALLAEIRGVFDRQRTNYRIVRMPLYDQVCLSPEDRHALEGTFGPENVFDFTGVNEYTADERNFYDPGHVRADVVGRLLRDVYGGAARAVR